MTNVNRYASAQLEDKSILQMKQDPINFLPPNELSIDAAKITKISKKAQYAAVSVRVELSRFSNEACLFGI
ncbi:MAG: hypothetical protein IH585_13210 [Anaerolineaceae bacterium]|nr:hypothetical protein [Anaerolineaceae bacterium]